jgi:hypothetical protein
VALEWVGVMPKNLQADIDWHRTRIAFYEQALTELGISTDTPETAPRQAEIRVIVADLKRTLHDLEQALRHRA